MRSAIIVAAWPGQPTTNDLERDAIAGRRPRKDYVELARRIGADVVDSEFIERDPTMGVRAACRLCSLETAQLISAFTHRHKYRTVVAWGDRLGTSLALAFKLSRSRSDLVLISVWLSTPKKTALLRQGLHSHVRAVVTWSSVQASLAAGVGVPQAKLALVRQRVDDRFWQPDVARAAENLIVAVGAEARDYPTLMEAVRGIDATAEVAIGSMVHTPSGSGTGRYPRTLRDVEEHDLPPNVRVHRNLAPTSLRDLYARARVVVVPLADVEFDAGATAIMEAMAMGKPLVVTRTRGQVDLVPDGAAGIYVPPGDPRALRDAIDAILTNPRRAEALGRHGRELVERRHRLDDWLEVLAGIVDGTIRPAGVRPIDYGTVLDGVAANGA